MPNFVRTQSPWIGAADAMQQGLSPLAQMFQELPQIRMRMQQHADQMGIQQGNLDLNRQELDAKRPVFAAQTKQYEAEATKSQSEAEKLGMLMNFARQAQAAKYQSQAMPMTNGPTLEHAKNQEFAALLGALAGSSTLDPSAAQRALESEQKPLVLATGQTAFPAQGGGPMAFGGVNSPFGNTVMGGSVPGTKPQVLQQGQFAPKGTTAQNPFLDAFRMAQIAALQENGELPAGMEVDPQMFKQVIQGLIGSQQAAQPQVNTNRPVIKSIKQIR